jgi:phosphoribosylamine-glycine ligase
VREAAINAYTGLSKIHFDGIHYRRDIAHQAL